MPQPSILLSPPPCLKLVFFQQGFQRNPWNHTTKRSHDQQTLPGHRTILAKRERKKKPYSQGIHVTYAVSHKPSAFHHHKIPELVVQLRITDYLRYIVVLNLYVFRSRWRFVEYLQCGLRQLTIPISARTPLT